MDLVSSVLHVNSCRVSAGYCKSTLQVLLAVFAGGKPVRDHVLVTALATPIGWFGVPIWWGVISGEESVNFWTCYAQKKISC